MCILARTFCQSLRNRELGRRPNCACTSINPYIPSWSEGADSKNAIVGAGLAISVEKRVILSIVFASLRLDVVNIRKSWGRGRGCGLV